MSFLVQAFQGAEMQSEMKKKTMPTFYTKVQDNSSNELRAIPTPNSGLPSLKSRSLAQEGLTSTTE